MHLPWGAAQASQIRPMAARLGLSDLIQRRHPLAWRLRHWWLCLPARMGGSRWHDLAGNNHGTLTQFGAASGWRGSCRPGGYGNLLFDGQDDYVSLSSLVSLSATAATVAAWHFYNEPANGRSNLWGQNGQFQPMAFLQGSTGQIQVRPATGAPTLIFAATLQKGNAYHVCFTHTANILRCYINGQESPTAGQTCTLGFQFNQLGRRQSGGASNMCAGGLDDVRAYDRALSSAEVKWLYQHSLAGLPGLLKVWGEPFFCGDFAVAEPPPAAALAESTRLWGADRARYELHTTRKAGTVLPGPSRQSLLALR